MKRLVFLAIPAVLGVALSFVVSELLVERSATARRILAAAACSSGSELTVGNRPRAAGARGGGLASGLYASCVPPGGQPELCESCSFIAAAPFVLLLGVGAIVGVWAAGRQPSALDHLAALEMARRLGSLSPEQYDELKREVLADPKMTPERLRTLITRSRS